MRPRRARRLLALAFIATLAAPPLSAHAWTRTVVESARATVEVERDATLSVLLRLDIEVHAGWLHELALVDLGPELELDRYRPPYFRSEDGEVLRPEAELREDGGIRLWFPRRDAPRRGKYRVFMRYRTRADVRAVTVDGEPRARIVWSVPTWETGLHNATVELRAPKGTTLPEAMHEPPPGVAFEVMERPGRTVMRWRRIHVPRMTAWPISVDAPADAIALPSTDRDRPQVDGFRPLARPEERPVTWALFVLAALALLKRRSLEKRIGRQSLWFRGSWAWAASLTGLAVLVAQWLAPTHAAWSLPLFALAMHRPLRASSLTHERTWKNASSKALTKRTLPDPLDGTTPAGAVALVAASSALLLLGQAAGALLLLPIFFTGTRLHVPQSGAESLQALRRFASELRVEADAPPMCFRWERADDGAIRLRLDLPSSRPGLRSLSFISTSSALGLVQRRGVMLAIETRAQSDADDLMRRRMPSSHELRDMDGSILRLVPWDADAVELLRVLARKAPKTAKVSRGTWLLREITAPGRRAA